MTGITRTGPTSSSCRANPSLQNPPRPPNAWILYRSDKLKALSPPEKGQPRRPQADISKMLSTMWKAEPQEVKEEYRRRSEIKKIEHKVLHPTYRFQPMKKAEKDRIRAERRAENERERNSRKQKATLRGGIAPAAEGSFTDEVGFGPPGPSSAASSSSTPPSLQFQRATQSQPTPSAHRPTPPTDHITPNAPAFAPMPFMDPPQPGTPNRTPATWDWQLQTEQQQPKLGQNQPFNSLWLNTGSQLPPENKITREDLDVPATIQPSQRPLGWSPGDPAPLNDLVFSQGCQNNQTLQAVVHATDDPNVFDINGFDFNELFDGNRDIEVISGANAISPFDPNGFSILENMLGPLGAAIRRAVHEDTEGGFTQSLLHGPHNA